MTNEVNTKRKGWTWEASGAVFGLVGGILAAALGGFIAASAWLLDAELHPWLQMFGTLLLISTVPLLVFGGYCLDWLERKRDAKTINRK